MNSTLFWTTRCYLICGTRTEYLPRVREVKPLQGELTLKEVQGAIEADLGWMDGALEAAPRRASRDHGRHVFAVKCDGFDLTAVEALEDYATDRSLPLVFLTGDYLSSRLPADKLITPQVDRDVERSARETYVDANARVTDVEAREQDYLREQLS
jgi:hypothetical protein